MNLNIVFLFFALFSLSAITAQSDTIKGADLLFTVPNDKWFLKNNQTQNGKTIYTYKREAIVDAIGRQIVPNISFVSETIPPETDIISYSMLKRSAVPFKVISMFTAQDKDPKISCKNALGYNSTYTDKNGNEHTIYVVHLINGDQGVQIIMDIISTLFDDYEVEFAAALKSIKTL